MRKTYKLLTLSLLTFSLLAVAAPKKDKSENFDFDNALSFEEVRTLYEGAGCSIPEGVSLSKKNKCSGKIVIKNVSELTAFLNSSDNTVSESEHSHHKNHKPKKHKKHHKGNHSKLRAIVLDGDFNLDGLDIFSTCPITVSKKSTIKATSNICLGSLSALNINKSVKIESGSRASFLSYKDNLIISKESEIISKSSLFLSSKNIRFKEDSTLSSDITSILAFGKRKNSNVIFSKGMSLTSSLSLEIKSGDKITFNKGSYEASTFDLKADHKIVFKKDAVLTGSTLDASADKCIEKGNENLNFNLKKGFCFQNEPTENEAPISIVTCTSSGVNVDCSPIGSSDDKGIISYSYLFSDGTELNNIDGSAITHSFLTSGNQGVVLTVTDAEGLSSNSETSFLINLNPVASFSCSSLVPNLLNCVGSASEDSDGSIVSYSWSVSDGSTHSGESFTHSLSNGGTFEVTLTVTDNLGGDATASKDVNVLNNQAPVSSFVCNSTSPNVINCDGGQSLDNDGIITSFSWSLSDGSTHSGSSFTHTLINGGSYNVTLAVTDDLGAIGTSSQSAIVLSNQAPVAIINCQSNFLEVSCDGSLSTDSDGAIATYEWSIDGKIFSAASISYLYETEGSKVILLKVTDDLGGVHTSSENILIEKENLAPIVSFNCNSPSPLLLNCDGTDSSDIDGTISSYEFDLGDGTILSEGVISHTFAEGGSKTINLSVTDDKGKSSNLSLDFDVAQNGVPSASLNCELLDNTLIVNCDGNGSVDDVSINSYKWTFENSIHKTGAITSHEFPGPGIYQIVLEVQDEFGASSIAIRSLEVKLNAPPIANFTCVSSFSEISCDGSSSSDADGDNLEFRWEIDDVIFGTDQFNHLFNTQGSKLVKLTVVDSSNASSSLEKTFLIKGNESPISNFICTSDATHELICDGSSSSDLDGSIASFNWSSIGGLVLESGETTRIKFDSGGLKLITLSVLDDQGSEGSISLNFSVQENTSPIVNFVCLSTDIRSIDCQPLGTVDPDGTILSYHWNFGDGSTSSEPIIGHRYNEGGIKNISLTAADNLGGSTTTTKEIEVISNQQPIISFTCSKDFLKINCDGSLSYDIDGDIELFEWTIDGQNYFGETVSYDFEESGIKNVSLMVTDNLLTNSIKTLQVEVTSTKAPIVSFDCTSSGALKIECDALASVDLDGEIENYSWKMGDETVLNGMRVSHTYSVKGSRDVELILTDNDGEKSSLIQNFDIIENQTPNSSFNCIVDDLSISCNGDSSNDSDGEIVFYSWSVLSNSVEVATYSGSEFTYTHNLEGEVEVSLAVTDNLGSISTSTDIFTLEGPTENEAPYAYFKYMADGDEVYTYFFGKAGSRDIASGTYEFVDLGITGNLTDFYTRSENKFEGLPSGIHELKLTLTDSIGVVDTFSHTIDMTQEFGMPYVSFELVHSGLNQVFINAIESFDPYEFREIEVDWGDGSSPEVDEAYFFNHTYDTSGTFNITVKLVSESGLSNQVSKQITLEAIDPGSQNPVANFESFFELDGENTRFVRFYEQYSGSPNGDIISYHWDFGDGFTTTGSDVIHFYDPGSYLATLTVTDFSGLSDTQTQMITITDSGTNLLTEVECFRDELNSNPGAQICDIISVDKFGELSEIQFDWGDGINEVQAVEDGQFSENRFFHSYENSGVFTARATAKTSRGDSVSFNISLNGNPDGPAPGENILPVVVLNCENINGFTISCDSFGSNDPDGFLIDYYWEFGDGTQVITGPQNFSITHQYEFPGEYIVGLTVVDNLGEISFTSTNVSTTTIPNEDPIAAFDCLINQRELSCDASSSFDNDNDSLTYSWSFGDGSAVSSGVTVNHTFDTDGDFEVSLMVTDEKGATGATKISYQIEYVYSAPVASFSCLKSGSSLSCESLSSDIDNDITESKFEMGDGTVLFGNLISHDFLTGGSYTVTNTVTDAQGLSATSLKLFTLDLPPIAEFNCIPTPLHIECDASNSNDDGFISSYSWKLGNGAIRNGKMISYDYQSEGSYIIDLEVVDNRGQVGNSSQQITIPQVPPTPPIAVIVTNGDDFLKANFLEGEEISLNYESSLSGEGEIVNYKWFIDNVLVSSNEELLIDSNVVKRIEVKLEVESTSGLTHSTSKYFSVSPDITPSILLTKNNDFAPVVAQLEADYPRSELPEPVEVSWTIEESQLSGDSVEYKFLNIGTKNINLIVRDGFGFEYQVNKEVEVKKDGLYLEGPDEITVFTDLNFQIDYIPYGRGIDFSLSLTEEVPGITITNDGLLKISSTEFENLPESITLSLEDDNGTFEKEISIITRPSEVIFTTTINQISEVEISGTSTLLDGSTLKMSPFESEGDIEMSIIKTAESIDGIEFAIKTNRQLGSGVILTASDSQEFEYYSNANFHRIGSTNSASLKINSTEYRSCGNQASKIKISSINQKKKTYIKSKLLSTNALDVYIQDTTESTTTETKTKKFLNTLHVLGTTLPKKLFINSTALRATDTFATYNHTVPESVFVNINRLNVTSASWGVVMYHEMQHLKDFRGNECAVIDFTENPNDSPAPDSKKIDPIRFLAEGSAEYQTFLKYRNNENILREYILNAEALIGSLNFVDIGLKILNEGEGFSNPPLRYQYEAPVLFETILNSGSFRTMLNNLKSTSNAIPKTLPESMSLAGAVPEKVGFGLIDLYRSYFFPTEISSVSKTFANVYGYQLGEGIYKTPYLFDKKVMSISIPNYGVSQLVFDPKVIALLNGDLSRGVTLDTDLTNIEGLSLKLGYGIKSEGLRAGTFFKKEGQINYSLRFSLSSARLPGGENPLDLYLWISNTSGAKKNINFTLETLHFKKYVGKIESSGPHYIQFRNSTYQGSRIDSTFLRIIECESEGFNCKTVFGNGSRTSFKKYEDHWEFENPFLKNCPRCMQNSVKYNLTMERPFIYILSEDDNFTDENHFDGGEITKAVQASAFKINICKKPIDQNSYGTHQEFDSFQGTNEFVIMSAGYDYFGYYDACDHIKGSSSCMTILNTEDITIPWGNNHSVAFKKYGEPILVYGQDVERSARRNPLSENTCRVYLDHEF